MIAQAPWRRARLLDAIERLFGGPAKDREDRGVAQAVDGVVPPFPRRHHPPVEAEQSHQFATLEEGAGRSGFGIGRIESHQAQA
jgi:hypothetical protein